MKLRIRTLKKNRTAYLFILPVALCVLVFLLYPIWKAAVMSFQYWYLPKPKPNGHELIGLDNYRSVVTNKYFKNTVVITIIFTAITVTIRYAVGLASALIMNCAFKGRGLARAMIIIPWAMPQVVACLIWSLMYDSQYGVINYLLLQSHMISENIAFIDNPATALASAMVVTIWKGFPFAAIMLLAGLQGISTDQYEACRVDGARALQTFWYVTLPGLKPVSVVTFLLLVMWTLKDFAIVYALSYGGPMRSTEIITIFIYNTAFRNFDFGMAAAAGMIMMVFSLLFTWFYLKALKMEDAQ